MTLPGEPDSKSSGSERRSWSDLGPRFASAIVLIIITVTALVSGGYLFALVVGAAFAGAFREWEIMITRRPLSPVAMGLIVALVLSAAVFPWLGPIASFAVIAAAAVLAFVQRDEVAGWRAAGIIFMGTVIVSLLALRGSSVLGIEAGVYLGTIVWMTDSAAFFTGRQVGGEKLAPEISPSKTWSGAFGGLALGTAAGTAIWLWFANAPWWVGLLLAAVISILSQLGDLSESAVKRRFRIKDSGDLIPGHGGLMDRLDSLTFGAIFVCILGALHSGFGDVAAGVLNW